MANDPILHLLGLAKKAGKLEIGEEPVVQELDQLLCKKMLNCKLEIHYENFRIHDVQEQ